MIAKTLHHSIKMSSRLQKYLAVLKLLKKTSTKVRKNIMKDCNRNLLCCLCECAQNVLKGNVPLSKRQRSKLSRFRDKLWSLAPKKTRIAVKKFDCSEWWFRHSFDTSCTFVLGYDI